MNDKILHLASLYEALLILYGCLNQLDILSDGWCIVTRATVRMSSEIDEIVREASKS